MAAGLITMADELPVFGVGSVAVRVTLSARLSLVLMVKVPADSVLVLSTKLLSPLLSNCALPLLVMVTTVVLSVVTVLFLPAAVAIVVVKGTPAVCGELALTT